MDQSSGVGSKWSKSQLPVVSDRGTLDLAPLLDDNNSEGMMLSKQANNRKTLSKTIHGQGGCFKVAGNSHIPLPKAMSASATIISSQTVAEVDKFDKCHDDHISGVRLEEIS
ncbi:hypothetical protein GOBAR_DD34591 [Gossypium barbadense]|nr:hypothetical protein GOBAR_DD34591 [Gossypium barbadense]